MNVNKPQRLLGLAIDAGVMLAFGCVMIAAGHGTGPIGVLMFAGSADAWGTPMTIGWTGIALLAMSALVPPPWLYGCVVLTGLATIVVSWSLFVIESASLNFSLVFSIPFICALAGRLMYLVFQLCGSRLSV